MTIITNPNAVIDTTSEMMSQRRCINFSLSMIIVTAGALGAPGQHSCHAPVFLKNQYCSRKRKRVSLE